MGFLWQPGGGALRLEGLMAGGNTSFYNAIAAGLVLSPNADRPQMVFAFSDGLDAAKVDWEFISYGGAVHSFTVKTADALMNPAMAYNANADKRSWRSMLDLFAEKGMAPRK